jgi:hypothetical protein
MSPSATIAINEGRFKKSGKKHQDFTKDSLLNIMNDKNASEVFYQDGVIQHKLSPLQSSNFIDKL